MSFIFNFTNTLASNGANNILSTNHNYSLSNQTADYVLSKTVVVPANSQVTVELPGFNTINSFLANSENLFDVSLDSEASVPVFSGIFGNSYSRAFQTGALYDNIILSASSVDAVVQLSITGLASA